MVPGGDTRETRAVSSAVVERIGALLHERDASERDVDAVLADLAGLSPRLLLEVERRAWFRLDGSGSWRFSEPMLDLGLSDWLRGLVRRPRATPVPSAAHARLTQVVGLLSRDGYERERAIGAAPTSPLVARLLAIRTADWVGPVRHAAMSRLAGEPRTALVDALPIAVRIHADWKRGDRLLPFVLDRLSEPELRSLATSDDALLRRAVWDRLLDLDAVSGDDLLGIAEHDADPLVRLKASRAAADLPMPERRAVAEQFVRDRVGYVAAPAFRVLAALDGEDAIAPALTARSTILRRSARSFARLHGMDARAVVLERLAAHPAGRPELLALAELADARDRDRFRAMLADGRSAVQAAGLRALARVDPEAGRSAALERLASPSPAAVSRVAANVLRQRALDDAEAAAIEQVALDRNRSTGDRLRALDLLRTRRWQLLATTLDAHAAESAASDGNDTLVRILRGRIRAWPSATTPTRTPDHHLRARITRRLSALEAGEHREILFALRTSG